MPPLGPTPVVSSATGWPRLHRRERAGAEGRLRGLWGEQGRIPHAGAEAVVEVG